MLQAHHSTALNFSDEVVSFEGTVASVKWINPHGSFVLEVTNEDGVVEEWLVEMLARIALQRGGFDFDAFEEGDRIQVSGRRGYREYTLRFGEATLPDGTVVKERLPTTQRFRK
ncbi:MAG: DUF6152 family protein [Arenicellaceae bacterium]|nr:DUF6152 family protein [Arenicellaceae bacterium]